MALAPAVRSMPAYLPQFDPDHFRDPGFFRELERIGYRTILLGGTGGARMRECVKMLREHTTLELLQHPSSPGEVCPVDCVLLPAVMNSNSHYTRPFGSGAVACALAAAELEVPFLPVAYFVLGESTARWYTDAFLIHSKKLIVGYCMYARMLRFEWVYLDYEDPAMPVDPSLIAAIRKRTEVRLMVCDELEPEEARGLRGLGVDTIVTPSNLYEEAADPLALALEYHRALLA